MNAGNCWEQEYNRPNGLSVEKALKSDLYLYLFIFRLFFDLSSVKIFRVTVHLMRLD